MYGIELMRDSLPKYSDWPRKEVGVMSTSVPSSSYLSVEERKYAQTPEQLSLELSQLLAAQAEAMKNAVGQSLTNDELWEFHRRQVRIRRIMKLLGIYREALRGGNR